MEIKMCEVRSTYMKLINFSFEKRKKESTYLGLLSVSDEQQLSLVKTAVLYVFCVLYAVTLYCIVPYFLRYNSYWSYVIRLQNTPHTS